VRYKFTFLAGVALGYVLGARAGRARYEQMSDLASRVAATEPVQKAREAASEQASHLADVARAAVGEKVGAAVADGRQRVEEALGDRMPERLRSTDATNTSSAAPPPSMQTSPGTPNGAGAGI
jgi:hypothetical protein